MFLEPGLDTEKIIQGDLVDLLDDVFVELVEDCVPGRDGDD